MSVLLLPAEAARYLGVSTRTLARYVSKGYLTPVTLPSGHKRFKLSALEEILQPNKSDEQ